MALPTQNRSFWRGRFWRDPAHARLPWAAALAASALLGTGLGMGCNTPVSPTFELYFAGSGEGDASCQGGATMEAVRLMCDSTVRVRILDANGNYDVVPPACQDLELSDHGTMQALEDLDIEFPALPLGRARVQVEIWRAGALGPAACGGSAAGDEPDAPAARPAVIGQARLLIGEDAHVRVPLDCPDLGQVNRFAPGCGLDVAIGDLDRGTKLSNPPRDLDDEEPPAGDGNDIDGNMESDSSAIELEDLQVVYGYARSDSDGSWEFIDQGSLALRIHDDGSAVWRDQPNEYFWEKLDDHETLCIQVTRNAGEAPQLSCIEAGADSPSSRVQASYLPPEDLDCLLAANGAGSVPPEGIVMGRVVQPVVENDTDTVQVELPAANVQVFPLAANLPVAPEPRLKIAADIDPVDDADDEDVRYVSKEPELPSRTSPTCRVDDTSATTSSGYFLSNATFPAHWEVETGSVVDGEQSTAEVEPGRVLVGGRLPGTVSIVRIPLR
jgi:hypothetical protein